MRSQLKMMMISAAFLVSAGLHANPISTDIKSDSLRQLQDMRAQNVKRLKEIDSALGRRMEDQASADTEKQIESLKDEKHEHLLRQEFLDRLIFQIDTKFSGGDLRGFLEHALINMAKVDATQASNNESIWKFLKYAADAIHRLPEQKENILAFLEGYMDTSVSNPTPPQAYLATRNYTNGAVSESGNPVSRSEAGAIADERLRQLSAMQNPPAVINKVQ